MRGLGVGRLFLTSTLVASLIASLLCGVVRGDDLGASKSFHIRRATFAPIGKVYSLGEVSINGRATHGEDTIWGGEMLRLSAGASACLFLDSVGNITLKNATIAKLGVAVSGFGDNDTHRVLVASLISGDMIVKLQQNAEAYVETCGSAFTSSKGASFHLAVLKGQAVVDATSGAVWAEALMPQQITISRVGFDRNTGLYPDLGNDPIKQKRNKPGATGGSVHSEELAFQVKGPKGTKTRKVLFRPGTDLTETQVAQDEEPIADTTVLFELSPADIGSVSPQRMQTDAQGIARTTFTAGPDPKAGKLKVTAEEKGRFREWNVIVLPGFWTTRNKILIGGAAAAAVIGCILGCSKDPGPLRQQPPPTIP